MTRSGRVELGEHRLLDLHALGHRLDHEVDVAEALVGGRPVDASEDLLDLRVGLLGGDLALLDELVELARGDFARLVEPGLHELLVDVLEHHRDPRGGDRLGDLPAHGACADDGCLEHEHAWISSGCFRVGEPSAAERDERTLGAPTAAGSQRSPPATAGSKRIGRASPVFIKTRERHR